VISIQNEVKNNAIEYSYSAVVVVISIQNEVKNNSKKPEKYIKKY
jgi:hypothetical protein